MELYPTLEVAPVTPRTDAYLAHSPIPVQFTEEDFDQVLSGNFVTKVIYLPDPEFQELALAGVETLVSTRLDPGVDPIAEADRRGSILAIVRMGNKDLEAGLRVTTRRLNPSKWCRRPYVTPHERRRAHVVRKPGHLQRTGEGRHANSRRRRSTAASSKRNMASRAGPAMAALTATASGVNMPMGMPTAGFAPPAMPPNYDRRRTAMGHADHRHADRPARSAAHSAGHTGRLAAARDEEPHADPHAAASRAR